MPLAGRFTLGVPFVVNRATDPGVRITRIQPDSYFATGYPFVNTAGNTVNIDAWLHGAMTTLGDNWSMNGARKWSPRQGFTSVSQFTSRTSTYNAGDNADPALSGPIEYTPGQRGVVWKAVNYPTGHWRTALLQARMPLHVVDYLPAPGDLPPPFPHVPGRNSINLADIDMTSWTSTVAITSGRPNPSGTLGRVRYPWENLSSNRPTWDRFVNGFVEPHFRRDAAKILADALLLSVCDIDPATRNLLRAAIVHQAQDTCAALENGWKFDFPHTDGGVQNGRKPVVVMAALLTGDPWFAQWAQDTTWSTEDVYVRRLPQSWVDRFAAGTPGVIDGFLPEDVDVPWWQPGVEAQSLGVTSEYPFRTFWRRSYQEMFHVHMVAADILRGIIPGWRAMWNNDAIWEYCDRMHKRTLYNGYGPVARGLAAGGTNNPSQWMRAMYLANTPPDIWNWT